MANLDFISKAQFEAVYDHFKQVDEDAEASREELGIEYRLLLGYFRSLYGDSERKGNKIKHLTAELSNFKEKSEAIEKQKEKDVMEIKETLTKIKRDLDKQRKKELINTRLIEKLGQDIFNLTGKDTDDAKKSKSDTYIQIPPRKHKYFREIAVDSSEALQSFRNFKLEEDMKENKSENSSIPENSESIRSEKGMSDEQDKKNLMSREIEFIKTKYEGEIERLQNQVKIISNEAKLLQSEVVSLKKCIDSKDKHFSEDMQKLSAEKEFEKQKKENLETKNFSLQMKIDNLSNDLKLVKEEKQILQGQIENSKEERHKLDLQIQAKGKHIENLQSDIDSLKKSKQSAAKKIGIFEENLAMDREQLKTAKKDIDVLNHTINELRIDLYKRESQLNQQESLCKRLEASQKTELLEQNKLLDYYKAQLVIRDKSIKSLTTDLEQTNEKLAFCRRQLRNRRRENAMLAEEFEKWKKTLGINTENMKSLKWKLDSAETSKSVLRNELKFTKTQYFSVLKERNKFRAQCQQLDSVIELREMENDLLSNRQEYLGNNLKIKEARLEKIAKLRRLTWANH